MFRIYHLAMLSLSACGIVLTQLYPMGHLTLWQDFHAKVYGDFAGPRAPSEPSGGQEKPLPRVRVAEVTIHGDMDCFKVQTPTATYVYGKKGAGFASILDQDGRDWISYRPGDKAKGEYRGLPKCGQADQVLPLRLRLWPVQNPMHEWRGKKITREAAVTRRGPDSRLHDAMNLVSPFVARRAAAPQ